MSEHFFTPRLPDVNENVILKDREHHHFARVMRGKKGGLVELIDGKGGLARAECSEAGKKQSVFTVREIERKNAGPKGVSICFAPPKGKRLSLMVRMCTELGAGGFHPLVFERSVRKGGANLAEEIRTTAVEALKQSGRLFLPFIADEQKLEDFISRRVSESGQKLFFGDQKGNGPGTLEKNPGQVFMVIGPEGGMTETEKQALAAAGAVGVKLAENTLRVETACVAATSVSDYFSG